jgi:hypothetical protein
MLYLFGGAHPNRTQPGYHFSLVHPSGPHATPYIYVGEDAARQGWNLTQHHSHLYRLSDDMTSVTLVAQSPYCSDSDVGAPSDAVLDEKNQERVRRGVSKIIRGSYPDRECPDCGEPIPLDVAEGDACSNCGHVFVLPRPSDDGTS